MTNNSRDALAVFLRMKVNRKRINKVHPSKLSSELQAAVGKTVCMMQSGKDFLKVICVRKQKENLRQCRKPSFHSFKPSAPAK